MFWKTKNNPKESKSTAMVRQDSRTNVKTATAQSETTNTTVQNSTIVNSNTSRITFQTTRQTVTHRQQARVTEIVTRRTPTPEELEEMLRQVNISKTAEAANSSGSGVAARRRANNLPAITSSSASTASSIGGISSKSTPKFKNTPSPLSRTTFTYDVPKIKAGSIFSDGGGSGAMPKTPTLVKIEETTVTTKNGRKVTSHTEQQRIKFDSTDFKTSATFSNSPFNKTSTTTYRMIDAKPVAAIAAPPTRLPPSSTTRLPPLPTTLPPSLTSSSYASPYTKRTLYSTPIAAVSTPTFSSSINAKTTTKLPANSIFNKPAPSRTTTTTSTFSPFASEFKTKPITKTTPFTTTTPREAGLFKSYVPSSTTTTTTTTTTPIITSSTSILKPTNIITKKKKSPLKPGYVYIFNNETFDNSKNEFRTGSKYDEKALRQTFEYYKLNVSVIKNATLEEIRRTVNKIETTNYSKHSCIVIVILSHGTRYEEVAAKDGTYSIDNTILFPMLRNHTLNEKPKIFFIQACKGSMEVGNLYKDAVQPQGSPNEILKCYSTFEGYVSYRQDDGSMFIQTLCEYLKKFGETKHIKEIMDEVMIAVKQQSQNKQIPSITSTLTVPYTFGDYI